MAFGKRTCVQKDGPFPGEGTLVVTFVPPYPEVDYIPYHSNDEGVDDEDLDDEDYDDESVDDEGADHEGADHEGADHEGADHEGADHEDVDNEGADEGGFDDEGIDDKNVGHQVPRTEAATSDPCPDPPVLEGATSMEKDEVANMPQLDLGPGSLNHVFPWILPSSVTVQAKADDEKPTPIPSEPHRQPPNKWYLHRAPSGRLTTIGRSPLCQEATKSLLEEAEKALGQGLEYAGYRIFKEDPRKCLGLVLTTDHDGIPSNQNAIGSGFDAMWEELGPDYAFDVELPPDEYEPATFPFASDDETSDDDSSDSSLEAFSMHRADSLSLRKFGPRALGPVPALLERNEKPLSQQISISRAVPQTKGRAKADNISDRHMFNPRLSWGSMLNGEMATRPVTTGSHDLARLQFKNRRGPLWNMVNKDLEKLFVHATNLHESEFLELVFCESDEVQTWLAERGPRIIHRSLKRYMDAHNTLTKAGIQPRELKEEVLEIFELMSHEEQADFIRVYQKLFALVKSSQEGLHLTPSEMEHFSRLSLPNQYEFINNYKARREERESIVRRDTAIFTAKLRRTERDSDELPFPDRSSPHSLESLYPVDSYQARLVHFCKRQQKIEQFKSSSRSAPSPSTTAVQSKADSAIDTQLRKLSSPCYTWDGRVWRRESVTAEEETSSEAQDLKDLGAKCGCGFEFGDDKRLPDVHGDMISDEEDYAEYAKVRVAELEKYKKGILSYAQNEPSEEILMDDLKLDSIKDETVDKGLHECASLAASRLPEALKSEEALIKVVHMEATAVIESLPSKTVLEESPRPEWQEEHPGVRVTLPTPPSTVYSSEGVISPVFSQTQQGNDTPLTTLCTERNLALAAARPACANSMSEPRTWWAAERLSILTKDHKTCIIHVDVLSDNDGHRPFLKKSSSKNSLGHATPSRRLRRSTGKLPADRSPENSPIHDGVTEKSPMSMRKKESLSEKSPRSLRKKASALLSSLRSKKSRPALQDINFR